MKTTVEELIVFVECITSESVQEILKSEKAIYSSDIVSVEKLVPLFNLKTAAIDGVDEKEQWDVMLTSWMASVDIPAIVEKDREEFLKKATGIVNKRTGTNLEALEATSYCNELIEKVRAELLDLYRLKSKEKFDKAATNIESAQSKHRIQQSTNDTVAASFQHLKNTAQQQQNENRRKLAALKQQDESRWETVEKKVAYAPKALGGVAGGVAGALYWIAYGLGGAATYLGKGVATNTVEGGKWALDKMKVIDQTPNYQGLLSLYETYLKVKPIFGADDDVLILEALKNDTGTPHERELNKLRIAQVEVVLSDAKPDEFIRQLNHKLLGLEQQIWKLAVQPAYKWDNGSRELLSQVMGLLLCIEQTNRDISVDTLVASDNYQTNDAWWKIFSVISALIPGLLVKVAALNYLSHLFGSSGHISGFIGNAILKALGGTGVKDSAGVGDNEIRIQTNNADNSEIVTGALLTTGLAVEAFAMIVATRIAYMNYASATDAFKSMIQQAEKTATNVVERCSVLLKDRLNSIDRALPLYETIALEDFEKKLLLAKQPDNALKMAYLGVRKDLGKLRSGNDITLSNIINLYGNPKVSDCVQLLQGMVLKSEDVGATYPSISHGMSDLSNQVGLLAAVEENENTGYQDILRALDDAVHLPVVFSVDNIQPDTGSRQFQDNHFLDISLAQSASLQDIVNQRFQNGQELRNPNIHKDLCVRVSDYMLLTISHRPEVVVAGLNEARPLRRVNSAQIQVRERDDIEVQAEAPKDDFSVPRFANTQLKNAQTFSLDLPDGQKTFELISATTADKEGDSTLFKHTDGIWYKALSSQKDLVLNVDSELTDESFERNVKVMLFKQKALN